MIFFPVAVAFSSAFFATLVPNSTWIHKFGLGGLFGETSVGVILKSLPEVSTTWVNMITLMMSVISLLTLLFVSGFSRKEVSGIFKFLLKGSFLFCTHIFALVARIAFLSISRKSSSMQGNYDQGNISTQKTGGFFSRIPFILKPSIGKETSQLVREEPMIDNDSHERGDRIRNKITSIIRDRTPPVTSKMTDANEEYDRQKVEDTFVSTNRASLDPVSYTI